jgi:hypothetical protein
MFGDVDGPRAWSLTQGMARLAGVNLPGAVVEGWLTRDELDRLVDRCAACGKSAVCIGWMATARRAPLPDFCCNKHEIEALSPEA